MENPGANRAGRISLAKPVPVGSTILGHRAGGPNTAHPGTQIVSTPYLRVESLDGKLGRGKVTQDGGERQPVKFQLTVRSVWSKRVSEALDSWLFGR